MKTIVVQGWFLADKEPPDISGTLHLPDSFIKSARKFELANLRIVDGVEMQIKGFFSGVRTIAVVDLTGSIVPFFVEKTKVERLRKLINEEKELTSSCDL